MSLSRDMSGHVGTLSRHFAYVGKYHEDKCLVLETCRDMSQDIYILGFGPLVVCDFVNYESTLSI